MQMTEWLMQDIIIFIILAVCFGIAFTWFVRKIIVKIDEWRDKK